MGACAKGRSLKSSPRRDEVILRKRRYDLKDLVAAITDDNLHGEVDWGAAEGAEAW